ncbi:RagB/SusD family nutrient uptake outer membrane protein [Chitinophaga nivalis]|uniref:RagB/SusD family nutrient uptake outer membrane protein n=1 Tax=Chitinophaga nivalis TaxID=2991709 RepID=A0ABT3IFG6_9BACT|nr:RagB/SusD family nutrient uptake outer membrane protein [Chitinophaga nivalis]MCW3467604.1 RagB/SusD family nutrient uptake outer membrane protein [Chitinophaga nivalis]MCW3482704.1 RagB/SusD family nutrient uptake outer membrane protein [Chitinophaga nivalis]
MILSYITQTTIRIFKILLILSAGIFVLLTGGCRKYLEQPPDSSWTDLSSPAKVGKLLGTAYPQSSYVVMCESMTDNVTDKGAGVIDRPNEEAFLFKDITAITQDSPEAYWEACYTAIATANLALQACNQAPDPKNYRAQKGEALLARAYAHFMLVNIFAQIYDPATAATNPGIPYVTVPETVVMKQYERKTVAYVYDMIEKDLLEGLPMISNDAYSVPRYHFNRSAAYAFATRFYLFKKDYSKVLTYASHTFSNNDVASNMRQWNTVYASLSPARVFELYASAKENANLLLVETSSRFGRYVGRYRYDMDYITHAQIFMYNVTGGAWCYPLYYTGSQDYLVPKLTEYFVKSSGNGTIGQPYVMLPLFTTEEVLFNRAEANAWQRNVSEVLEDLNLFAAKRIRNYDPSQHTITLGRIKAFYGISDTRSALIRTILDFKRAEYVQEGMRWFDLLRYKLPVEHQTKEGQVLTLNADDYHRVFQIPQSATTAGIALNPR